MLSFSKINSELLYIIKRFIFFIICLFFVSNLNGQKITEFHGVELPDSVANYLETLYPDMNVSAWVFNIISPNKKNGLMVFLVLRGKVPTSQDIFSYKKEIIFMYLKAKDFIIPKGC